MVLLPIYASGEALKWEKVEPSRKDKNPKEETVRGDSTEQASKEVILS
jgi:hypothetical protein